MKIAVFFNLPGGGAKRTLFEQVQYLSKNHTVDVYTLKYANHEFSDLRKIASKYYIYNDKKTNNIFQNVRFLYTELPKIHKKISEDIDKNGYDGVLVHPDLYTQSPYLLKYTKTPTLYYCHEIKREFYENIPRVSKKRSYYLTLPVRIPLKGIDKSNAQSASAVIVNSIKTKNEVQNQYQLDSEVIYPGVNLDIFQKNPKIKKENIVVSVGGFNLLKGHDLVIKSIGNLLAKMRPTLVIVGNGGEDKEYLIQLAKERNVTLTIKENIQDRELCEVYNKAKVLISASQNEPFGLSPLEALSCGTQVISLDGNGVNEVIRKLNHVYIVERNENSVTKKITQVINNEISEQEYQIIRKFLEKNVGVEISAQKIEEKLKYL